jgi:hypothetical protein
VEIILSTCLAITEQLSSSLNSQQPVPIRKNSVAWVRERNIPIERPPLFREVSANFLNRGCHVVSVTDPYGRILAFLDWSRYFFFQVSPQLYSRGAADPVPDSLLLRKSVRAGSRIRTSAQGKSPLFAIVYDFYLGPKPVWTLWRGEKFAILFLPGIEPRSLDCTVSYPGCKNWWNN